MSGLPEAWSADAAAVNLMRRALAYGFDVGLFVTERNFLCMPLMLSEAPADLEDCVALFRTLAAGSADEALSLEFVIRHRDFIARFGRFPHRNDVLCRTSTPEEIAFLLEPNSSF
tara:strand:- start:2225 stop:2569 length:345 start_codon:yes stop_codon:yes gene_type:complete